jgi:F420-dependent oxidoreductase-like protein
VTTRYGLQLPNFNFSDVGPAGTFGRVVELARAAEDTGFESVWVMDHLLQLPALGGPPQPMLEAYTLLGALAASTERVRLGALVTGVTYRNPALLAKQVSTLDVISGGRAMLGIGAAWYDVEHTALGFDFPPLKERFERLAEAVDICRAMFSAAADQPVSYDGRWYQVREALNVPSPLQGASLPIMIGGGGEKKTLRLVAEKADLCNVAGDLETVRHKLEVLRQHCSDVGRNYDSITKTRLGTILVADNDADAESVRSALGGAPEMVIGTLDSIPAQVRALADVGFDVLIFNMPYADPAQVAKVGDVLGATLG